MGPIGEGTPLQQWYSDWLKEHRDTGLIHANPDRPSLQQVHFVRDVLAYKLWSDLDYDELPRVSIKHESDGIRAHPDTVRVIGEHRSKSVRLPVFSISRPAHGLRLVMRYNFHDWNVSVVSERPVEMDVAGYGALFSEEDRKRFPAGYRKGSYWGYLFFQGFPDEFWFGPYSESKTRFSLAPSSDYELYSFVRELSRLMIRGGK